MGDHLQRRLIELRSRFSFISDVRGKGLLVAMEFENDIAGQLLTHANAGGLLLNAVKPNTIRFMPPLNVTADEIDQAISRLGEALAKI